MPTHKREKRLERKDIKGKNNFSRFLTTNKEQARRKKSGVCSLFNYRIYKKKKVDKRS